MIKHYLNFISSGHGRIEIQEPVGFDATEFDIVQEEGRKGRDVISVGANSQGQLRIYNCPEYPFDIFLYNKDKFGFEAKINYELEVDETNHIIGSVANIITDRITYIEFFVIESSETMIFKRRLDVKTNLFSSETLSGDPIVPVPLTNVLVKAKPILKVSTWEWNDNIFNATWNADGNDFAFINPFVKLKSYDIGDSYAPFEVYTETGSNVSDADLVKIRDEATLIRAKTNLRNIKIKIKGLSLSAISTGFPVRTRIAVGYGTSYQPGQYNTEVLFSSNAAVVNLSQDYEVNIPSLDNTGFIFIQISFYCAYTPPVEGSPVSRTIISFFSESLTITATEVAYNTIVPMVRLIDAMRYNVKSSSNLNVIAPRWEQGGELYDQYITTQALMRGLTDKPFYMSTKDILEEYMPEVYGDYQLQENGDVFLGASDENGDDFYKDIQIGEYTQYELSDEFGQVQGQILGYEEKDNQRFRASKFNFSYKTFSSQKENEQYNTYDDVHGQTEWLNENEQAENTKDVQVGWIRSAFSIEEARRKSYNLSDTSATQDDDKVYIVDTLLMSDKDRVFKETSKMQHRYNGNLLLTNDNSFDFVKLGIINGTTFIIENGPNAGTYTVVAVQPRAITLLVSSPKSNIDEISTTFVYYISSSVCNVTIWTNEFFSLIDNIQNPDSYANLRFTPKRNILKRYNKYLAASLFYRPGGKVKNTLYKNNPEAITQLLGKDAITEGADIFPSGNILTPNIIKVNLLMTLKEFLRLRTAQRQSSGYIKTFMPDGLPLTGYIQKGPWKAIKRAAKNSGGLIGVMEAEIEERYQMFYIAIFKSSDTSYVIDGVNGALETNTINFEIVNERLILYSETGKQLQPAIPYDRVKVNNSGQATSATELTQWLNAIIS